MMWFLVVVSGEAGQAGESCVLFIARRVSEGETANCTTLAYASGYENVEPIR